ncbi:hypothetical protein L7F22_028087 [Adiantum nelumboides]|nr:hypothetical protein [Adiantum nelumboides]
MSLHDRPSCLPYTLVYFNVKDTSGAYGVWSALSNLYEKKSAASQVYWLKKLIDLRMKESTPMSNHLNEFHTIVSQLQSQGVEFDDSVRAMFLLVTLPDSWDTFCTTVCNSAAPDGLKCADVESSLLMEEVNCKNVEHTKSSSAMHVRGRSSSRENFQGGILRNATSLRVAVVASLDLAKVTMQNNLNYNTLFLKIYLRNNKTAQSTLI